MAQRAFNLGTRGIAGTGTPLFDAFTDIEGDLTDLFPNVVLVDGATIAAIPAAPYQMLPSDRVIDVDKTNSTAGPTSIALPTTPVQGMLYMIVDGRGDAGTNPITVLAGGQTLATMNENGDAFQFVAVKLGVWRIV